ncbi:MAG: SUMF1/EgtB/PvdO family nonheme iron enzyme [Aquimonas sp.]|nr:SUMF1/EgtB/PvdO family nonheme iron enzyme [Aquimonas sp.]
MTEQIGRFHVRKRLGGGVFGEVFLAEDPTIGRQVAIKVFHPKDENLIAFATSSNTEGLEILRTRFLNEAKILATLDEEPHIVSVLEFGEMADGTPYYVMPYLPKSLAQELGKDVFDVNALAELAESERPRALPMEQALDVVEQTLKGLAAAHAHGLVHRDITPGNLMRSENGRVRIVDFGIAKAPDGQHSTVSYLGMGSRNYMAPEQRESAKNVDARADVYAVGRVFYRMLTGKLPVGRFADPNVAVPALGKAMNDVILAAINEDREERPADASELLKRFQQARKSVGKQESSEHPVTWAGEQGESGLRDELKPLKARISALVSEQGFLGAESLASLSVLAAIADLDEPGLSKLIHATINADRTLATKAKLGELIRKAVVARGSGLDERVLGTLAAAGEAVGWDAGQLSTIMQAAVAELPKASPGAAGDSQPATPTGSAAGSGASSTGSSAGARSSPKPDAPKPTAPTTPKPRSKLPAALAALLVLGGAGYGVYEWRQAQIAAEQIERALSEAKESEAAAWQQARLAQLKASERLPAPQPGDRFRDCTYCPELVVIPAGSFSQGSPSYESAQADSERPVHTVQIRQFSLGRTEVTRGEFRRFAEATGFRTDAENNVDGHEGCFTYQGGKDFGHSAGASWRNSGFAQDDSHPVVCVSWNDAKAYVDWLRRQTGNPYRLPSESELEYANRAGTTTPWPWGSDGQNGCGMANYVDYPAKDLFLVMTAASCSDGHVFTAPVARFRANAFGLHDTAGNVLEWAEDCFNGNYNGAPTDGWAWTSGDCARGMLRGGSYNLPPISLRAGHRIPSLRTSRGFNTGFRVAQD